ncbi:MAG: alpha/beta fold hydrolase, partial [Acidimicrobiales bacterium]
DTVPGLFSARTPPEKVDETLRILSDVRPTGVRVVARGFAAADLRPVLARIETPTLLLYGDADERAPLPVAEALLAGLPNATLVTLAGAGHELCLDAPAEFDAEVRRFLRAVG